MKTQPYVIRADQPKRVLSHHCSVHIEENLFRRIEDICLKTHKSRNAVISELLDHASRHCVIDKEDEG